MDRVQDGGGSCGSPWLPDGIYLTIPGNQLRSLKGAPARLDKARSRSGHYPWPQHIPAASGGTADNQVVHQSSPAESICQAEVTASVEIEAEVMPQVKREAVDQLQIGRASCRGRG